MAGGNQAGFAGIFRCKGEVIRRGLSPFLSSQVGRLYLLR